MDINAYVRTCIRGRTPRECDNATRRIDVMPEMKSSGASFAQVTPQVVRVRVTRVTRRPHLLYMKLWVYLNFNGWAKSVWPKWKSQSTCTS